MSESRKNNTLSLRAIEGQLMPEEQTFQARLRCAMFDGIKESDVTDVVKQIVEKAKAGDVKAQQMMFDYLLGAKTKPTQVVVNNHFESVEDAARVEQRKRA